MFLVGFVEHGEEGAELYAVGVGFDFGGFGWEFVDGSGIEDAVGELLGADDGLGGVWVARRRRSLLRVIRSMWHSSRRSGGPLRRGTREVCFGEVWVFVGFVWWDEGDLAVGVGDGGLFEVGFDGAFASEELGFHFDRDTGAGALWEVFGFDVDGDFGFVFGGVHREFEMVGGFVFLWSGGDDHWLAGGHEPVHAGGGDSDALLTSGHFESVEL